MKKIINREKKKKIPTIAHFRIAELFMYNVEDYQNLSGMLESLGDILKRLLSLLPVTKS